MKTPRHTSILAKGHGKRIYKVSLGQGKKVFLSPFEMDFAGGGAFASSPPGDFKASIFKGVLKRSPFYA